MCSYNFEAVGIIVLYELQMKLFKQNLRRELILYDQEKLFLISLSFIRLLTCIQFTRLHFTRSTSSRMKRKSKLFKEGYLTVLNVERCCSKSFLKHEEYSIRSVSKHRVARSNILNSRRDFLSDVQKMRIDLFIKHEKQCFI